MSTTTKPEYIAELVSRDLPDDVPEGFIEMPPVGQFDCMMGRIFGRREGDEMVMGFRVSPRHINAHGTCHGGMIASFADMLAYAMRVHSALRETSTPTVSLSIEYLRPIMLGDWVEANCDVVKQGKRFLFSKVTATVKEKIVFTATAINIPGAPDIPGRIGLEQIMGDG